MRFSVFPLYGMFCLNSFGEMTIVFTDAISVLTEIEKAYDQSVWQRQTLRRDKKKLTINQTQGQM